MFNEGHGWDWSTPGAGSSAAAGSEFIVEFWARGAQGASPSATRATLPSSSAPGEPEESTATQSEPSAAPASSTPPTAPSHVLAAPSSPAPASPASPTTPSATAEDRGHVKFATPLEDDEDHLDAYHDDDEPLRYRTMGNILGDAPTP